MTLAFTIVRALHFASLMMVFGASALMFQARGIGMPGATLRRLFLAAAPAALVTAVAWFFLVTEQIGEGLGLTLDTHTIVLLLRGSSFGESFVIRAVLLAGLCVACLWEGRFALKTMLAGASLALLAVTSHAAAAGPAGGIDLRTAVDAAHLVAAGFWVGGLVVLAPQVLAKPRDTARLIALLRLFSRWGVASVGVLLVAGTLNAVFILGAPGMRWSGLYISLLAAKIVLAGLMVALAMTNRFGVLPGLERGDREAGEMIPITVIAELACSLLILGIVGFLGLIPPMQM